MVEEARLVPTENGLVPEGEGWFVVNAREARWWDSEVYDRYCRFQGEARFPQVGFNISVLEPGRPACLYHGEENQEDFLVVSGECLLLVEGEERRLGPWDFFHCPPWTEHVMVGAGSGPCVVIAVGARTSGSGVVYPRSDLAGAHGASARETTESAPEAYADDPDPVERPYAEGDLPAW
jgi:uncharacterized cupin superfamily protein